MSSCALELGVIIAALASGALVDSVGIATLLAIPAIVVTLALSAIWFGVAETPVLAIGRIDWPGFGLITAALGLLMGGLVILRLTGPSRPAARSGRTGRRPDQPVRRQDSASMVGMVLNHR